MTRLLWTSVIAVALVAMTAMAKEIESVRTVPDFKRVSINGGLDAEIVSGVAQSVVIIADDEVQKQIETEVKGDTLVIRMRGNFNNVGDIRAKIGVASLEALKINGSSDVTMTGIDSEEFAIEINGSGDVRATGKCGSARYETNGSGDIDATALRCRDVDIEISGSGDMDIYASGALNVSISGSGDVTASGDPSVKRVRTSGSGSFSTRN
ncbi:MAG: hypothetical protein Kow00104_08810 [Rhodothalassiaceae bacterium]